MKEYISLIKNRDFFLLWISQIISQFGDKLNQMALIAWAYSIMPGSSFQMAKLIFFTVVPVFIIGPFAATAVDRLDQRKTMYICDLLRAISVITIPTIILPKKLILPVYFMVFISFSLSRLFVPAKMSIIPNIVPPEYIMPANSLLSLTGVVAAMLGFGIGGMLVQNLGIRFGFTIDAFTFFISAIAIYLIGQNYSPKKISLTEEALGIWQTIFQGIKYLFAGKIFKDMQEGLSYLSQQKDIQKLIKLSFLLWALLGGIYATIIVFIQEALGTATSDLGLLVVFLGAGTLLGSLLWGKLGINMHRFKMLYISLLSVSALLFLFAVSLKSPLSHKFAIASSLSLLLGLAVAPMLIVGQTIVHESSSKEMQGRIFGVIEIIVHLAFVMAMFVSSLLAEFFSEASIIILWSGIGLGISIDGLLRIKDS